MAQSRTTEQRDERAGHDEQHQQNQRQQNQEQQNQQQQREGGASARGGTAMQGTDRERRIRTERESARSGAVQRQSSPASSQTMNSPFSLMRRMAEDMDRIFEDFGFAGPSLAMSPLFGGAPSQGVSRGSPSIARFDWMPQIETRRRGDNLVVHADLPGMRKEDVHVEVDDGILTISGERSEQHEGDRDDFYRSERSYGQFYRALPLPEGVDENACEATFKDGVLEVTIPLPKQQDRKAKQIQVR
jgi:HSP20 family protein